MDSADNIADTFAHNAVTVVTPAQVAFPDVLLSRAVDRTILSLRAARVAFGVVLVVGALALVAGAVTDFHAVHALQVLGGTWLVAVLAVPLALLVARTSFSVRDPGRAGDRSLFASFAWPIAGLALLLPLTIHGVFNAFAVETNGFDDWVQMSCLIVGHCHVALALMGVRRMRRLVDGDKPMPAAGIFGVVVGIAMVPGALLLMLPPLLVAATGLPFLFLLWVPQKLIAKERAALA